MRTLARPNGRLPARVYWVRRTMVLVTALALVFAVGRLFTGSDDEEPGTQAVATAAEPSTTPTATPTMTGPLPLRPAATGTKPATPRPTSTSVVLAEPSGPCAVDEITVTPTVPRAVAGQRVDLVLELTGIRPACTFAVSSRSVVARVTSGKDRIWTSQDCRASIRSGSVVVRSATPTKVVVHWSGRRSDDDCTRSTDWALPGFYHVTAAVIGSEPGDVQFELTSPPRQVITKTAKPKAKKKPVGD